MLKWQTLAPSLYSIRRVIDSSGCNASQFYRGILLRTLERWLEITPMLVCFIWLLSQASPPSYNAEYWSQLTTLLTGVASSPIAGISAPLFWFTSLLLLLFLGQLVTAYFGQRQSFVGSYRIIRAYRERLIDHTRQLPLGTLYQYRTGQLADILTQDIKRIEAIFTHIAADFVSAFLAPLLWLVILSVIDWQLATSVLIAVPLALIVLVKTQGYFRAVSSQKQALLQQTAGVITEYCLGLKTLKLFNKSHVWISKLNTQFQHLKQMSLGVEAWGAGPVVSYRLLLEMSTVTLLVYISLAVDTGNGQLWWQAVLVLMLILKVLTPLLEAAEHLTILRFAIQSEHRLNQIFSANLLPEPQVPAHTTRFDVHFQQVDFAYQQHKVLNQVSFEAKSGKITALVGHSGAGKSTIVNLLARFYQPTQGHIRIGGVDLEQLGTERLYEYVSVVFQQVQLVDGRILDNVRAGKPNASKQEVIAACQAAHCHDFIAKLPEAYETWIGEDGVSLSGGERQRLAIARALLKDAPILLLDEITASVDPTTQIRLQQSLNTLVQGKTVIVVAHRLSTIRHADQILVMAQGRICERGNHDTLMAQNGQYAKLWRAQ